MFYVYVLENKQGEHYIGFSENLRQRLTEHNQGKNLSTRSSFWRCIYYESCLEESDARRREKYLKTSQGRRLLKRRIKDYMYKRRVK